MNNNSADFAICVTCGTQFGVPLSSPPTSCRICDDPRQYVPPTGQAWTSLSNLRSSDFKNVWTRDEVDEKLWFITSEPKIGIGQRAIFMETEHGNILWDMVPYIDERFIEEVNAKGGLKAIVISHPHFYTTHLEWAAAFSCSVYLSSDDKEWLCRPEPNPSSPLRTFLTKPATEIIPGITAIKAGGHFPGSLVLHSKSSSAHGPMLLLADTIMTVPVGMAGPNNKWTTNLHSSQSGLSPISHPTRQSGTTSYSFMWSYPNMIPLSPDAVLGIWEAIKEYAFTRTYGGFMAQNVRGKGDLRGIVLESMKIWVKAAGHEGHAVMMKTVE